MDYTHTEASLLQISGRTISGTTLAKMKARIQTVNTKDKIRKAISIPVKLRILAQKK